MAQQCWDEARHCEISVKLSDWMGTSIGEFSESPFLYEAACNPDPVLRLTGVNRAWRASPSTSSTRCASSATVAGDPGARVLRGLDARRRGDPREDGLRLAAPTHRHRQGAPGAGVGVPEGRRQAVQPRRVPRRGGRQPGAARPPVPGAGRLRHLRDGRARRHRPRGEGGGGAAPGGRGRASDSATHEPRSSSNLRTFSLVDYDADELAGIVEGLLDDVGVDVP